MLNKRQKLLICISKYGKLLYNYNVHIREVLENHFKYNIDNEIIIILEKIYCNIMEKAI